MTNFTDFPEAKPEKLTWEEKRALLFCFAGVGGVIGLALFLSKYLYLL
jgi:hypothetical protein